MRGIKNFDRDDCAHYAYIKTNGCCGRKMVVGLCTIPDAKGNEVHRTCSMKQSYCQYQPREEDNVHPTQLSDPDSGNSHSN